MRMRGQTEYITTHWIPVVRYISLLVMVVIEKKWQYHMLMNPETVQNHQPRRIKFWVVANSVVLISHQGQQLASSAGTGNLIIVLLGKAVLAMAS